MKNEALTGRIFVAIPMVAFGIQHLIYRGFITRIATTLPRWIPGDPLWACLIGVVLIACGVAILIRKSDRQAAYLLGWFILALTLLFTLPPWINDPANPGRMTNLGKGFTLCGSAFLVFASLSGVSEASRRAAMAGRVFLSLFFILCGIEHFTLAQFVAGLVPAWIPGHLFWTYFAGVALIAGGIGMLVPMTVRLAALLSALMLFCWVILLHIPRALANVQNSNETTAVFEALCFTGAALLIAYDAARRKA